MSAAGGELTRGGYTASLAALAGAQAQLAALGASPAAMAAALQGPRNAARGQCALTLPPFSVPPGASLPVTASIASPALLALLPELPPVPGSPAAPTLDAGTALLLGPPGATFSPPFTLCIMVGDLPPASVGALVFSSLRDAAAPGKGYGPFELGSNGSYSAVTGQVCAQGSHFSVGAVMVFTPPPPVYAPRSSTATKPSGSCPAGVANSSSSSSSGSGAPLQAVPGALLCSNNGRCTGFGVCQCFPGWTGMDCSQRTCPGGESWGQSSYFGDARQSGAGGWAGSEASGVGVGVGVGAVAGVRLFEECSGRGLCNRGTGLCACYSGYEGAACARLACPAAPAPVLTFAHIDHSAGADAAEAEMAWEAAFSEQGQEGREWAPPPNASAATARAGPTSSHSTGTPSTAVTPCSGNGRCLLLRDLPTYSGSAYAKDWASERMQRCLCDDGWGGPDCSQRTCPSGTHPQACQTCPGDSAATVTALTLALPLPPDATGASHVAPGSDDLVLSVCGGTARTPAIHGAWAGTPAAAAAIAAALAATPCLAASGTAVAVAPVAGGGGASLSVSYLITTTSSQRPASASASAIACPAPTLPGCTTPGCRPFYAQPRALLPPPSPPAWLAVSQASILQAPPLPAPAVAGPEAPAWGVTATLVLSRGGGSSSSGGGGAGGGAVVVLHRWSGVAVYGGAPLSLAQAVAAGSRAFETEDTPLPPGVLRQGLVGPFGLVLNVSEADDMQVVADMVGAGPSWSFPYAWSLPSCSAVVTAVPSGGGLSSECSSAGLCDRGTGLCQCFPGYQGSACQRGVETAIV